jgi:hypothetical protein
VPRPSRVRIDDPLEIVLYWIWLALTFWIRAYFRYFWLATPVLTGEPKDNATFNHAADKDYRGRPAGAEKLSKPKKYRLARRWAFIGIFCHLIVLSWILSPWEPLLSSILHWLAIIYQVVIMAIGGWWLGTWLQNRIRYRKVRKDVIGPAAKAVRGVVGPTFHLAQDEKIISLPPSYTKPKRRDAAMAPVQVNLPQGINWTDSKKKQLTDAAGGALGLENAQAEFFTSGAKPFALLSPLSLPGKLTLADCWEWIEKTDKDHPFIGLGADGGPRYLDYKEISPHWLWSGPTGTGKTSVGRDIFPQWGRFGAALVIFDYKRISSLWAHNLPGCLYLWELDDIERGVLALEQLLEARKRGPIEQLGHYDDVVIMADEIPSMMMKLQRHYKRKGRTGISPAVEAFQNLIFMGRELQIFYHPFGNRLSAKTFGPDGGDARTAIAGRGIAKYDPQAFRMLAGGIRYVPWPGGGRGIWGLFFDDRLDFVRVPLWTDGEAREVFMSGKPSPDLQIEMGSRVLGGDHPVIAPGVDLKTPELESRRVSLSKGLANVPGPAMELGTWRRAIGRAKQAGWGPEPVDWEGRTAIYLQSDLNVFKLTIDQRRKVDSGDEPAFPGIIYAIFVRLPDTGQVVCGYVGQTRRSLEQRFSEHEEDQPWADLIYGPPVKIFVDNISQADLDVLELRVMDEMKPIFNWIGNETANEFSISLDEAIEQRWQRDDELGRPRFIPKKDREPPELEGPPEGVVLSLNRGR